MRRQAGGQIEEASKINGYLFICFALKYTKRKNRENGKTSSENGEQSWREKYRLCQNKEVLLSHAQ